jgi:hypothetical protein
MIVQNWECPVCEYDRDESGGMPIPPFCPLCAADNGREVQCRIIPEKDGKVITP